MSLLHMTVGMMQGSTWYGSVEPMARCYRVGASPRGKEAVSEGSSVGGYGYHDDETHWAICWVNMKVLSDEEEMWSRLTDQHLLY